MFICIYQAELLKTSCSDSKTFLACFDSLKILSLKCSLCSRLENEDVSNSLSKCRRTHPHQDLNSGFWKGDPQVSGPQPSPHLRPPSWVSHVPPGCYLEPNMSGAEKCPLGPQNLVVSVSFSCTDTSVGTTCPLEFSSNFLL